MHASCQSPFDPCSLLLPLPRCCSLLNIQDATETETDYRLRIDLPGFIPEKVDIELQGDKLNITAKKEESKGADKVSHRLVVKEV
jgi:hypothetical protein